MEKPLKALIVDDEENARQLLQKMLEDSLCFSDIKKAESVALACKEIKHFRPDVIFLDIKMPGKDGFSFIDEIPPGINDTEIVFVTAYNQYAIKAIKSKAFDYLLKPVDRKELKECILKLVDKAEKKSPVQNDSKTPEQGSKPFKIKIHTRSGILFLNPAAILYIKADGNYSEIYTDEKMISCSLTLRKVEELLPPVRFLRVGRSFIFNYEYISQFDQKKSEVKLVKDNQSTIVKVTGHHLKDFDKL
jgi:two-component system LytT family response regulator